MEVTFGWVGPGGVDLGVGLGGIDFLGVVARVTFKWIGRGGVDFGSGLG